jgi:hypothetical protein
MTSRPRSPSPSQRWVGGSITAARLGNHSLCRTLPDGVVALIDLVGRVVCGAVRPWRQHLADVSVDWHHPIAPVRARPSIRQVQSTEKPIRHGERDGVVLVPRTWFIAVMPVVKERCHVDPFDQPPANIDVGTHEQPADPFQDEHRGHHRHREAEHQHRQRGREPGEGCVQRMTSGRRQPVELHRRVMDPMKPPQHRGLVAEAMTPVAAHL